MESDAIAPTEPLIPPPPPAALSRNYTHEKFDYDHSSYRMGCGVVHVTRGLPVLVAMRTLFYLVVLILPIATSSALVAVTSAFSWIILVVTVASLFAAMRLENFALFIPSLFLSLLVIFLLSLYTFVVFLELTNLRGDLTLQRVASSFAFLGWLLFEMYYLGTVWKAFVYICDVRMNKDAHDRRRESKIVRGKILETPLKKALIYASEDEVSQTSLEDLKPKSFAQKKLPQNTE